MSSRLPYLCALMCLSAFIAAGQAAQPEITISFPDDAPVPGEPFTLLYSLTWTGNEEAFLLVPEPLPALEWGTWRILGETAAETPEGQRIYVAVEITPEDIGIYEVPALRFSYLPADTENLEEAEPAMVMAPAPTVDVVEPAQNRLPLLIGAGIGLVLVAVFVGLLLRRRRGKKQASAAASPDDRVRDALHTAQRLRLDGDYYGYYQELAKVAELTAAEDGELGSHLNKRAQTVGYGGVRPTEDELNSDQRAIERAVARWKEERAK